MIFAPFPQEDFAEVPMPPKLPLPRGWKRRVRSSVLHILALSHYTFTGLMAEAAPVGIARFGQAQVDGSGFTGHGTFQERDRTTR